MSKHAFSKQELAKVFYIIGFHNILRQHPDTGEMDINESCLIEVAKEFEFEIGSSPDALLLREARVAPFLKDFEEEILMAREYEELQELVRYGSSEVRAKDFSLEELAKIFYLVGYTEVIAQHGFGESSVQVQALEMVLRDFGFSLYPTLDTNKVRFEGFMLDRFEKDFHDEIAISWMNDLNTVADWKTPA